MSNTLKSIFGEARQSWRLFQDSRLVRTSGAFNEAWYLSKYPSLVQARANPLLHYLLCGGFEGRDPSPDFCSQYYLDAYADVKSSGMNPLVHYLRYGRRENRVVQPVWRKIHAAATPASGLPPRLRIEKVFCLSMQRTGTTSVGRFFQDFGFRWAGWPADEQNNWSAAWYAGDVERIFSSLAFEQANAFEDSPWYLPDFYKLLFFRFPDSKFILFTRDPDAWFRSMLNHSHGNILGTTRIHCKVYRRELEFFDLLHSGAIDEEAENRAGAEKTMKLAGHAQHYKDIYRLHSTEVQDFFHRHAPGSLHVGRLEDPDKWIKLGKFLDVDVPENYDSRENVSHPAGTK